MPNTFTVEPATLQQLTAHEVQAVGADRGVRFVRFKHAILARAEKNKNQDRITPQGIAELAATLPLNAIDDEHKRDVVPGIFTDARVLDDGGVPALDVDGLLFADRFPQQTQAVLNGEKLLSIEAGADTATCSLCGGVYVREDQYCGHLKARLVDRKAERILSGLKATGGAITTHPAGTNTRFDMNHIELIASVWGQGEHLEAALQDDDALCFASELEYWLWRSNPAKAMQLLGKVLTSEQRKNMPTSKFAVVQKKDGQTVKRFPISDCEHARKALQLLPKAKDLSDAERATITKRAKAKLASPGCSAPRADGSARAVHALAACLAMDPTPMLPGMVRYRPIYSPLMQEFDPAWLRNWKARLDAAPTAAAQVQPPAPTEPPAPPALAETPVAATAPTATQEVQSDLEKHLDARTGAHASTASSPQGDLDGAPPGKQVENAKALVIGFAWENVPASEQPTERRVAIDLGLG